MVDSITESDVRRIENYIDVSKGDQRNKIEGLLRNRFSQFSDEALGEFAKRIEERNRSVGKSQKSTTEIERILRKQTTASGKGITGTRTTMIRDSNGSYFAAKKNVKTYRDRWGNIMGINKKNGKRKKLIDKADL